MITVQVRKKQNTPKYISVLHSGLTDRIGHLCRCIRDHGIQNVSFYWENKNSQYKRYVGEDFLDYFDIDPRLEFHQGHFIERITRESGKDRLQLRRPLYEKKFLDCNYSKNHLSLEHLPVSIKNCTSEYAGKEIVYFRAWEYWKDNKEYSVINNINNLNIDKNNAVLIIADSKYETCFDKQYKNILCSNHKQTSLKDTVNILNAFIHSKVLYTSYTGKFYQLANLLSMKMFNNTLNIRYVD